MGERKEKKIKIKIAKTSNGFVGAAIEVAGDIKTRIGGNRTMA